MTKFIFATATGILILDQDAVLSIEDNNRAVVLLDFADNIKCIEEMINFKDVMVMQGKQMVSIANPEMIRKAILPEKAKK